MRHVIPKESYIEVKFEDLIFDTKSTLINICEFSNMQFIPSMMAIDLSRHNIGRYRNKLSVEQVRQIEKKCKIWMAEKGYKRYE